MQQLASLDPLRRSHAGRSDRETDRLPARPRPGPCPEQEASPSLPQGRRNHLRRAMTETAEQIGQRMRAQYDRGPFAWWSEEDEKRWKDAVGENYVEPDQPCIWSTKFGFPTICKVLPSSGAFRIDKY